MIDRLGVSEAASTNLRGKRVINAGEAIHEGDYVTLGRHGGGPGAGHGGIDPAVAIPSLILAACGIGLAWFLYGGSQTRVAALAHGLGRVYTAIKCKFYFDELYLFVTKGLVFRFVAAPIAWFDRHIVDGGVNLAGWCTRTLGALLRYLQTGQVQTYGVWLACGSLLLLLAWWAWGI